MALMSPARTADPGSAARSRCAFIFWANRLAAAKFVNTTLPRIPKSDSSKSYRSRASRDTWNSRTGESKRLARRLLFICAANPYPPAAIKPPSDESVARRSVTPPLSQSVHARVGRAVKNQLSVPFRTLLAVSLTTIAALIAPLPAAAGTPFGVSLLEGGYNQPLYMTHAGDS